MPPLFVTRTPDVTWRNEGSTYVGTAADLTVTARRRWWGGDWRLEATAPAPISDPLIIFSSPKGMEHGFWRDVACGNADFDYTHFIFSDTPSLLGYLLGPTTRAALSALELVDPGATLYVRGGITRVNAETDDRSEHIVTRMLAVFRALATDRDASLAAWGQRIAVAGARAEVMWPPRAVLSTRVGQLRIGVSYVSAESSEDWFESVDTLRTHVAGFDDRNGAAWSVAEAGPLVKAAFVVGKRRYAITGKPPLSLDAITTAIRRGRMHSITAGREIEMTLHGLADERQLGAAAALVESILKPADSTSPYR
jgi:hypothetical protein